jgi:NAD(P)-dependent dehydrogenase (short-subunit alcohol dehydrogenase family)
MPGLDNDGVINAAYVATKAAANRFTEAVAGECFGAGVRVFSISPGMVKTDMTAGPFADLWDDADTWTPVVKALDLITDLAAGMLDALSGRYFRAAIDDWHELVARADKVISRDTNVLRLSQLPPAGSAEICSANSVKRVHDPGEDPARRVARQGESRQQRN